MASVVMTIPLRIVASSVRVSSTMPGSTNDPVWQIRYGSPSIQHLSSRSCAGNRFIQYRVDPKESPRGAEQGLGDMPDGGRGLCPSERPADPIPSVTLDSPSDRAAHGRPPMPRPAQKN